MRTLRNLFVLAVLISLFIMLFTVLHEINNHDLSTTPDITCNFKEKDPIYLVTYADGDIYVANEAVLAESAIGKCIDVIYMYRKEHLDEAFVEKNNKILQEKRGAGYWLWKPYFVLKTLNNIPENSILIYLDSGFKIMKPMDEFINNIQDHDIVLVDNPPFKNKEYIKRDLFKYMGMDNKEARETEQLSAGMFIVRNTEYTRNFIAKWLEIAEIPNMLDDSLSLEEYPEFKKHSHDQAILSLLYLQNKDSIKIIPIADILSKAWLHKRRSFDKSLYVSRDGNKMQMSFWRKRLDELLKLVREK